MSPSFKSQETHFKEIQSFSSAYSPSTLTQYESTRTGMRIVVVDQEGPKVYGSFVFATEIHDNSGAPHTLEHLCFLGSKSYKYKGMLDKLATRAYSETNAWTSTDHTTYSLESAGWEGFAQILPVYLEHLLVPTLTDAACYTEVHHIDGSGNDAGVVYSEMQGEQNEKDMLMFAKNKLLLYPEGVGFRYETFGQMGALRVLSADRIRSYHRETYQPKNLCLIMIGAVDHANLLQTLDEFEGTILGDIPKPDKPFKRPWTESRQAQPLEQSLSGTVQFPEQDENSGEVMITFFGPSCNDGLLRRALAVLLRYLAGSSASILEHTLVEKEQLASDVAYECESRPMMVIYFSLTNVATEKLDYVEGRFLEIVRDAAAKPIDLDYMRDCVKRQRRQVKFYAENTGLYFAEPILEDFLFGNRDGSTLRANLEDLKEYDVLETWDELQWRHWLNSWFAEAPHVSIFARPSAKVAKQLRSYEKARVAARKKRLGEQGLKKLSERLAAAKAENEREIPKHVLECFDVPSTKSINFLNTITAVSGTARKGNATDNRIQHIVDQDSDLPLFIHFEHVRSSFVHLTLVMGTEVISLALRPLLAIYMDNFFTTPMLRDGKVISFETVIMDLERDSVGYEIDFGQGLGNSETIVIKMQVEAEKYQAAIQWLRDLMFSSVFEAERLKASTTRMLAGVSEEKRDGSDMTSAVELMVGTAASSIVRATGTLTRAVYLKRVKRLLENDAPLIIEQLKQINAALCQVSNFRILVTANIEGLSRPVSSWSILTAGLETDVPLKPLDTRLSRLSEAGSNPGHRAFVITLPAIESSYVLAVGKAPSSNRDPALPALMIANSYLNAVEGPLWTANRGTGLAYSTNVVQHITSGQISLMIYRSPDASKAFVASKDVVESLATDKTVFDTLALEGAISDIVSGFTDSETTMSSAAQSSFVRQVIKDLPKDWPNIMLEQVRKVTVEEIKQAMRDFVLPVFEAKTANLFVTCAPDLERKIVMGFSEVGFNVDVKPLSFFQDDYGLKGEDDDEDDEEEEDEEDEEDVEGEVEEETDDDDDQDRDEEDEEIDDEDDLESSEATLISEL